MTRFTGVCWSMNSLTSVPHAPNPGRRQGRSRAFSRYHAMSGAASSGMRFSLASRGRAAAAAPAGGVGAPVDLGWMHAPAHHSRHRAVARTARRGASPYPGGRVIVAVDGIDGAGKTTFADGFAEVFAEDGLGRLPREHRRLPPPARRAVRARTEQPRGLLPRLLRLRDVPPRALDPFRDGAQTAGATGFQLAASMCVATPRSSRSG